MKKLTKRIYAVLLIMLMLLNYMSIIVTAATAYPGSATFELESKASKYQVGDTVLVDLKVGELINVYEIKQFAANVEYDHEALELLDIEITSDPGYINNSVVSRGRIFLALPVGDGTIGVGDRVCTLKFKALKSSETETNVKVYDIDATCNNGSDVYFEDGNVNEPQITLPVPPTVIEHSLKITKTNSENTAITDNSALFKITSLNGETIYKETQEDGTVTITNLEMQDMEGVYTIKEVLAPEGYIVNEEPTTVAVTFDEEGKVITANANNGTATIDENENIINVSIVNEAEVVKPEQEVFNLVLNKVDEENNSITSDTTSFDLTTPDGVTNSYTTQIETGKTENIALIAPETAGRYVYIIKETKAPEGYITEQNNIIVELTFEEQENKIVLVSGNIISYNNETIEPVTNDEVKTLTVNIKNEQEIVTYDYTINIDKVKDDRFSTNITEDSAIFEIEHNDEISYVKTNLLGKASYNFTMTNKEIVEEQEYVYTITEIKAPEGYVLDETPKTVKLTFNSDGSINTSSVEGESIEKLSSTTNVVNVKIVNETKPEEPIIVAQNFNLVIRKVDENNNLIISDSANFALISTNGLGYTLTTTNGVTSQVTLSAPNTAGKQVYFLKETKAPEGYDILEQSLIIEANFVESEGKIVISDATVKEYNKTIEAVDNTLTIDVTNVKHEDTEEIGTFNIKIQGVDENNTPIESGTTVLKITNKLTGKYIYKEVQIQNGIIELDMPKQEGETQYELQQVKAPEGYEANPNVIQLTFNFEKDADGNLELSDYTVNGEGALKDQAEDENTASMTIVNNEIKIEPEKQNYSVEISKLDSETNELIAQGSAIFTTIDAKGNEREYATTSGKVLIEGLVPGNAGESQVLIIKEKVAPDGYKISGETVILKTTFAEQEGKIVVSNYELIMGNNIANVQMQENNIKINIINEKEDEDLYVVSKKYSDGVDIYNLFDKYTGSHYEINEAFIDTKEAVRGDNVSVQTFINNLDSNGVLTVWDKNGNQVPNGDRVKTGMTLKATKGKQQKTFIIIVKGDGDGDGRVRTIDLNMLIKHISGEEVLTNPISLRALDLKVESGDGIIRTTDLNELYDVLAR